MGWASKFGRARVSARSPEAAGVCDRCGFLYSHRDLQFQYEYAGMSLQNTRILVCCECLDVPQDQSRALLIPPDPVPIQNARPPDYLYAETPTGPGGAVIGYPNGIDPNAQMSLVAGVKWAQKLNIISILANGSTTVTVNTNGPHGLLTNAQVSVEGLTNSAACGAFSITVATPTQFTYTALSVIPAASMAAATTRVITLNVGLPLGQTTIPPVGPT